MEKNQIAIIGSCVSRTMFNVSLLKNTFNITTYFFQPCVWSLFDNSFDILKDDIYSLKTEDFSARTLWYYLTGSGIKEIEKNKPTYIVIDIDNIRSNPYKLTFRNKSIYCQGTGNNFSKFIDLINKSNINSLKEIQIEPLSIKTFDENIIYNGLDKLINWLKLLFAEDKIILNHTQLSTQYFDIDSTKKNYTNLKEIQNLQNIHDKFFNYIKSKIPNSIVIKDAGPNYSMYGDYDNYLSYIPPFDHFIYEYHYKKASSLLNKLNINYFDYSYSDIDSIQYDFILQQNKYAKLNQRLKIFQSLCFNLNTYFDKIENPNDIILIISSKEISFNNIKYFRRKSLFNLTLNIPQDNCFIAISDPKNNFVVEINDSIQSQYSYTINNNIIEVVSKKENLNQFSSIKLNGTELSLNEVGLNMVLLNRQTFSVIDSINCSFLFGPDLLFKSKLLNELKLK